MLHSYFWLDLFIALVQQTTLSRDLPSIITGNIQNHQSRHKPKHNPSGRSCSCRQVKGSSDVGCVFCSEVAVQSELQSQSRTVEETTVFQLEVILELQTGEDQLHLFDSESQPSSISPLDIEYRIVASHRHRA